MNFAELDDLGNEAQFNTNYWEPGTTQTQETKKKKFSYDDILNSLNLVVNKSGVLHYISTTNTSLRKAIDHSFMESRDTNSTMSSDTNRNHGILFGNKKVILKFYFLLKKSKIKWTSFFKV
jgi:hypothetical protein